jgi:hypothetical protein
MTLETRKLTGIPPWPIVLLAGAEKVGKTWSAVEACMSPIVSGGLWFPLGEDDPDEYALIPGFDHDRFDLVMHDGTYRGLLAAFDKALKEERAAKENTPPKVWVFDSSTRLWDMLGGMAQREMYERLARKAEQQKRPAPDIEQKPSMDLWNVARDRWDHILDALRAHNGPAIITARMELTTVMNEKGEPTKDKAQKVQAQKMLPFDVGAVVEMPAKGETYLTGVRSVKLAGLEPRVKFTDFKVDTLWRRLGLEAGAGKRTHTGIDAADKPSQEADSARAELAALCDEHGWDKAEIVREWAALSDVALKDATSAAAIRAFTVELLAARAPKAAA